MRSRGSVEFGRMPIKLTKWAELLGEGGKKSSVGNWRQGVTTPPQHMREKIHELGGPDPDSWDEPYEPPAAGQFEEPADLDASSEASADDVAELASRQVGVLKRLQQQLINGNGEGAAIDQQIRMADQLAGAIDKLGKHTGVKLTTRQILASPLWAEVKETITAALEPWPDAMRAVADALDRLKAQ